MATIVLRESGGIARDHPPNKLEVAEGDRFDVIATTTDLAGQAAADGVAGPKDRRVPPAISATPSATASGRASSNSRFERCGRLFDAVFADRAKQLLSRIAPTGGHFEPEAKHVAEEFHGTPFPAAIKGKPRRL